MMNLDLSTSNELPTQEFEQLEIREGELHLRFWITPQAEFALPAMAIREVISAPLDRITPIPNSSPLVLGTVNLRGRVIWVADLGQLLGETTTVLNIERSEIPVIVIEEQDTLVGLAIEQIVGMEWLDAEKLQQLNQVSDIIAPFIRGEWVLNHDTHQCLRVLDHKAIIQSERWAA